MTWINGTDRPQWQARRPHIERWRRELGLYAGRNMAEELRAGLAKHAGTRIVFSVERRIEETTAGELWEQSATIAAALAARGLRKGDAIVNQLPSGREAMLVFLAAMRLGLVLVPVVHIYGAKELSYILRASRARALVLPSRWRNVDFAARVEALEELPDLEMIVGVGDGSLPGRYVPWAELAAFTGPELPLTDAGGDEVCLINFTSGTTSAPKGVMHSHHSLIATALRAPPLRVDIAEGPMIRYGPAGHIAAVQMIARAWLLGDVVIHLDHFEAGHVLDVCERLGATRSSGVPTHWIALLEASGGRLPKSLSSVVLGATPVPPALVARLDELGVSVLRCWGCTELASITCIEPDDPFERRLNSDGRPVPGCIVRAVDDEGRDVPRGQPGELIAAGPQMFLGYLDAELDRSAFTDDGFYRTGDIGVIDDGGFVTLVDRKKDIVIRGGENISSREVEEALLRHPSVLEAAVIGWPDERLGERVGAFVQLRPGTSLTIEEVRSTFAAAGMARQKTPEHLVVLEEFPRTAAGKVVKPELRRRVREGR